MSDVAWGMATLDGDATKTLVVDDDGLVRMVLRSALERIGHLVTEADERESAITAAALTPFDLVIIDARMPGRSLDETLAQIRAAMHPVRPGVLVISGAPVDDRVLDEHDARYLAKPVDLRDFLSAVRTAVAHVR